MRSIIVAAIVGAFSVVCYGLLKFPYIRRPMSEREEKRDLEDNKQFSDTKVDAAGLEREEKRDLEEDNKDVMFDAEAYVEGLLTSTSDDNLSTGSAEDCYAVLNVLKKLHDQNPMDVQILKTLAVALFSLTLMLLTDGGSVCRFGGKCFSVPSFALYNKPTYSKGLIPSRVKFELGRAHYYILESDRTVNQDSNLFMDHAVSAYRYFKEVEDKGPEVYKFPMLDVLRKFMGRSMSNLEVVSRSWRKASSSALYHGNAEQTKKEYGDPSNIPSVDVVCG